ncbi:hypothetical protein [Nioella aestuarii]
MVVDDAVPIDIQSQKRVVGRDPEVVLDLIDVAEPYFAGSGGCQDEEP